MVTARGASLTAVAAAATSAGPPPRALLDKINPHLICVLCRGYYIDATTIVECLHTFCRSCVVKHLRVKSYCPVCEMMINPARPNIKLDKALQDIVYKLVPGLFRREMARRREFYASRPDLEVAELTPEQRGEDTERVVFGPDEVISFSLEFADPDRPSASSGSSNSESGGESSTETPTAQTRRYLRCPAVVNVSHLKKFLALKFDIDARHFFVDVLYKRVPLPDHYTLMDVAYIYNWKRVEPMRFFYQISDFAPERDRFGFLDAPHARRRRGPGGQGRPDDDERPAKEDPRAPKDAQGRRPAGDEKAPSTTAPKDADRANERPDSEKSNFLNSFELKAKVGPNGDAATSPKDGPDAKRRRVEPEAPIIPKKEPISPTKTPAVNEPPKAQVKPPTAPAKPPAAPTPARAAPMASPPPRSSAMSQANSPTKTWSGVSNVPTKSQMASQLPKSKPQMAAPPPAMIPKKPLPIDQGKPPTSTPTQRPSPKEETATKRDLAPRPTPSPAGAPKPPVVANQRPPPKNPTPKPTPALQPMKRPSDPPNSQQPPKPKIPTPGENDPKDDKSRGMPTKRKAPEVEPIPRKIERVGLQGYGIGESKQDPKRSSAESRPSSGSIPPMGSRPDAAKTPETPKDAQKPKKPEGENSLRTLFNSCNINIPPSLSITLKDQDLKGRNSSSNEIQQDSNSKQTSSPSGVPATPSSQSSQQSSGTAPDNNYLEIIKLPDGDAAQNPDNGSQTPKNQKSLEAVVTAKGPVPNLKPISEAKQLGPFTKPQTFQQTFLQSLQQQKEKPKYKARLVQPKIAPSKGGKPDDAPPEPSNVKPGSSLLKPQSVPLIPQMPKMNPLPPKTTKPDSALDLSTPHVPLHEIATKLGQSKALATMESIATLAKKQCLNQRSSIGPTFSHDSFKSNSNLGSPSLRIPGVPTSINNQLKSQNSTGSGSPKHFPDYFQQLNKGAARSPNENLSGQQYKLQPQKSASPVNQNVERAQTRSPSSSPKLVIACPSPKSQSPEQKQLVSPRPSDTLAAPSQPSSVSSSSQLSASNPSMNEASGSKDNAAKTIRNAKPQPINKLGSLQNSNLNNNSHKSSGGQVGDMMSLSPQLLAQHAYIRQQLELQAQLGLLPSGAPSQWLNNPLMRTHFENLVRNMSQNQQSFQNNHNSKDK